MSGLSIFNVLNGQYCIWKTFMLCSCLCQFILMDIFLMCVIFQTKATLFIRLLPSKFRHWSISAEIFQWNSLLQRCGGTKCLDRTSIWRCWGVWNGWLPWKTFVQYFHSWQRGCNSQFFCNRRKNHVCSISTVHGEENKINHKVDAIFTWISNWQTSIPSVYLCFLVRHGCMQFSRPCLCMVAWEEEKAGLDFINEIGIYFKALCDSLYLKN